MTRFVVPWVRFVQIWPILYNNLAKLLSPILPNLAKVAQRFDQIFDVQIWPIGGCCHRVGWSVERIAAAVIQSFPPVQPSNQCPLYNITELYIALVHKGLLCNMLHTAATRHSGIFSGPGPAILYFSWQKCLETVFDKVLVAKVHQIMARRTWTWNLEASISRLWVRWLEVCACQSVARR